MSNLQRTQLIYKIWGIVARVCSILGAVCAVCTLAGALLFLFAAEVPMAIYEAFVEIAASEEELPFFGFGENDPFQYMLALSAVLAAEAAVLHYQYLYCQKVGNAGTPFTAECVASLRKTGILTMCISCGGRLLAGIMAHRMIEKVDLPLVSGSVGFGLLLLLASFIFGYATERIELSNPPTDTPSHPESL